MATRTVEFVDEKLEVSLLKMLTADMVRPTHIDMTIHNGQSHKRIFHILLFSPSGRSVL